MSEVRICPPAHRTSTRVQDHPHIWQRDERAPPGNGREAALHRRRGWGPDGAAIAIPNYIKFQARAKQAERKMNLEARYTAERVYGAEHGASPRPRARVGFFPERRNRYAYVAGPGPLEARSTPRAVGTGQAEGIGVDTARHPGKAITFEQLPEDVALRVGVSGECPDRELTRVRAGELDGDKGLDVRSISSAERQRSDGTSIPAGEPFNEVDDVSDR